MSDTALEVAVDLVVTGVVTGMSERDEASWPTPGQKLASAHDTVTPLVVAVEKGRRFAPGETLRFTGECNIAVPDPDPAARTRCISHCCPATR